MWPRSSAGRSSQVENHDSSAPAKDGSCSGGVGEDQLDPLVVERSVDPEVREARASELDPDVRSARADRTATASTSSTIIGREWEVVMVIRESLRDLGRGAAERHDQRGARHRVGDHAVVEAEDGADRLLGHDLGRRALGDDPAVAHGDQVVGVPGRQVEVVQHHHDGACRVPG